MNISSASYVSNAFSHLQSQTIRTPVQAPQVQKLGGDGDGDSDGSRAKVAQSTLAPTVNPNGQRIGTLINATA